jgi:mono/diheme cytochrome c family protein
VILGVNFESSIAIVDAVAAVVIGGIIVWRVVSLRRNPEPKPPLNLAPGMPDEELEGRKLERVLGWALLFTVVLALALPAYFLVEPTREANANSEFLKESVARGATLFANSQSKAYDSATSLRCADCHGVNGEGGQAPFTLQPEADLCQNPANQANANVPQCLAQQVSWQAPALNTELYRFSRDQATQIITYGRPGTPMPAWGVASGKGILGDQGIEDLVNYIQSIQISPKKAQQDAAQQVTSFKAQAAQYVSTTSSALSAAQAQLAQAQATGSPAVVVNSLQSQVNELQAELASAQRNNNEVQGLSDGAILFRVNCARCHTKNWSFYDPTKLSQPPPAPQGSGAYGPPLNGGTVLLQFPGLTGRTQQIMWVTVGVPANQPYGTRGISSGRMPHFGSFLSAQQIAEIVDYERGL